MIFKQKRSTNPNLNINLLKDNNSDEINSTILMQMYGFSLERLDPYEHYTQFYIYDVINFTRWR